MKHLRLFSLIPLFFAFFFCNSAAFGQDTLPGTVDEGPKRISGGYGYGSAGIAMRNIQPLNNFIGSGAALQGQSPAFGGGGMLMIRSIMVGGEGASLLRQKGSFGDQDFVFESGWGRFYMGYVLLGKKGLLLYPKVGIGGYKHSLALNNKLVPADMDSVITGNYTGTTLVKKGVLLNFGFGFEWMPGFDETAGSGIVLGLDAGYNLGITQKPWEANGTALNGGPAISPSGVYVNLHLGFGGWNRQ